jgi:hypothetical protein
MTETNLPVWYLQAGTVDAEGKFTTKGQASAVLVAARKKGENEARKLLLTVQHAIRSPSGPYFTAFRAWPPDFGYNDTLAKSASIFDVLTPAENAPFVAPEDLAFLQIPADATGSPPAALVDDAEYTENLEELDIAGYISGEELIKDYKGLVKPAIYPNWRLVGKDVPSAIGILGPGNGTPADGVSGGGVFYRDRLVGVYRGMFKHTAQHVLLPVSRLREWCEQRGYEMASLAPIAQPSLPAAEALTKAQRDELAEIILNTFNTGQLQMLLHFRLGMDLETNSDPSSKLSRDAVNQLINRLSGDSLISNFLEAVIIARPNHPEIQQKLLPIRDLPTDAPRTVSEAVVLVTGSIRCVARSLAIEEVRGQVNTKKDLLQRLVDSISLLRTYKSLHDRLHFLQMIFPLFARAARNIQVASVDFDEYVSQIGTYSVVFRGIIQELPSSPVAVRRIETDWVTELEAYGRPCPASQRQIQRELGASEHVQVSGLAAT